MTPGAEEVTRRCPELAGVQEAARMGGISRQRVLALRKSPGFPEPVQELACGAVWLASDLEAYFAVPRRPGRPRKASLA